MNDLTKTFELFHQITHAPSVRIRKAIADAGLLDIVQYRNITTGEEAARDYNSLNPGDALPVLRSKSDKGEIYLGEESILQWIQKQTLINHRN
jgi:hypothetical protein